MSGFDTDAEPADSRAPVRLWDWPIRLVHWSFVLLMPALWWTFRSGRMETHELLGYITLGLLVFRIFWGFAGGSTARFSGFVKGPRAVARYARSLFGEPGEPVVGHNPLGGWSALVLLGLMISEVGLGLFAQDTDGIVSGPLTRYVSYEIADRARDLHELGFNLLLGFIALHVAAILFYLLVKRDNLVGPMITGQKRMAALPSPPTFAAWWRIAIGAVLGAGAAWWVSLGCPL
ncbi:MAG: Ni/Fe-hydrogenase 1 b-type cytochrome subunit [Alphaproteobacteria bacterium]|nr:Ni/Fe-hydrogenase 1 b-type cytochrome subunit [Alphaproteobacteria bacterium]